MNILISSIVALSLSATPLFAQEEPTAKLKVPPTKVAVVNLKTVFEQYQRAVKLRTELTATARPFRDKARKYEEEIRRYEDELRTNIKIDTATRHKYEAVIRKDKFELAELAVEFDQKVIAKHRENLETLWKEVEMGTAAVAKAYEFQLVMPIGEPDYPSPSLDPKTMDTDWHMNENFGGGLRYHMPAPPKRDLRAPLFLSASIDLTPVLVNTLNKWASDKETTKEKKSEK